MVEKSNLLKCTEFAGEEEGKLHCFFHICRQGKSQYQSSRVYTVDKSKDYSRQQILHAKLS